MNVEVAQSPAEIYEDLFVPALFAHWVAFIADLVGLSPGEQVLDVACGTGVLARATAERVGSDGSVVGLDPNEEMLAVARRTNPAITWQTGRAEALPFRDTTFDAVVSQFGFMFFEDQADALREMMRVLKPGGRLAVAVCDAIDHSPGYAVLAELLNRLFGEQVATAFRAPFASGDPERLHAHCAEAGIPDAAVTRHDGTVRFDSIAALVSAERACAWTLGGLLDEAQFERLLEAAEESLQPFVTANGAVALEMPALIITATRT
ncbi:MAG TPA: methyltransferase domain-containing protein [Rhodothermales bacterium]|nr:methyltransferase domain-containing protein [Rhodothermales bacterium]